MREINTAQIQRRLDEGKLTRFERPAVVMITGSKGRRDIVTDAGLDWLLFKNNFDEEAAKADKSSINTLEKAFEYCKELAFLKLRAVKDLFMNAAVICADTVVFNRKLLEKPQTEAEVYGMIRGLNGCRHQVITGVGIYDCREKAGDGSFKTVIFAEVSEVILAGVTDDIIADTIRLENPYACSGGYTIDGILAPYFTILSGSRHNVIGLPLKETLEALRKR